MPLDYRIAERTLANGLRVIVSEDHSVPNVTVNLWVNVGSRHETQGRTGFAHLFEHLMFQGSRHVANGEHFSALMAEGGRLNATTWFDRTNYFETIPKGALELALWLEADRHGHLLDAVTQENLDNQRDVASLEDVHAFFRHYYGPNNSVLTIVGDIEPEDAFAKVETYFGPLPASAQPPPQDVHHLDPLTEPARLERLEDVPNDRLHLAWRLPVDSDEDYLACSLAFDVLGGLSTSRLVQRLVRDEQSATAVHAHTMGFVDGVSLGLLIIDVSAGTAAAAVEAAVVEEIERLIAEGPTDVELESSLAETERSWLSSLASQEERADLICHYTLLADDSHYVNTLLDRVGAIGRERIKTAAAAYLQPRSRTVVSYLVEEQEAAA